MSTPGNYEPNRPRGRSDDDVRVLEAVPADDCLVAEVTRTSSDGNVRAARVCVLIWSHPSPPAQAYTMHRVVNGALREAGLRGVEETYVHLVSEGIARSSRCRRLVHATVGDRRSTTLSSTGFREFPRG